MKFQHVFERFVSHFKPKSNVPKQSSLVPENFLDDYVSWHKAFDNDQMQAVSKDAAHYHQLEMKPLISLVMPVYKSSVLWLSMAIESVIQQSYSNWELCIVDDFSQDDDLQNLLQKFSRKDARIKLHCRTSNGHISLASNDAIAMATGDWLGFVDHDDLLHPNALYLLAKTISAKPNAMLLYSDEDKIDTAGVRSCPYFKPGWNQSLFYGHNFLAHLTLYRLPVVRELGGLRATFEGAQDYDLALRYLANIKFQNIHHIPQVLYHWRIHPLSTAHSMDAKNYAIEASIRALDEHFLQMGLDVKTAYLGYGFRVSYELKNIEVALQQLSWINQPCCADASEITAMNQLIWAEQAEYIGLLADGIKPLKLDSNLGECIALLQTPNAGVVCPSIWTIDGKAIKGGLLFGILGFYGYSHQGALFGDYGYFTRQALRSAFSAVYGPVLFFRKKLFQRLGGFDTSFDDIELSVLDFCLRANALGVQHVWTPFAAVQLSDSWHTYSAKLRNNTNVNSTGAKLFKAKWQEIIQNDPQYNPNLTLEKENFTLAWPPRTVDSTLT